MGNNFKTDKEHDLLTRMKYENKHLKKQLKAARKLLDRYQVAEKLNLFDGEKILPSKKRIKEKELYEQWVCFNCQTGILRLKGPIANRYWRLCDNCGKRTKAQPWGDDIKGVR
jgi:hypothetical protein